MELLYLFGTQSTYSTDASHSHKGGKLYQMHLLYFDISLSADTLPT